MGLARLLNQVKTNLFATPYKDIQENSLDFFLDDDNVPVPKVSSIFELIPRGC